MWGIFDYILHLANNIFCGGASVTLLQHSKLRKWLHVDSKLFSYFVIYYVTICNHNFNFCNRPWARKTGFLVRVLKKTLPHYPQSSEMIIFTQNRFHNRYAICYVTICNNKINFCNHPWRDGPRMISFCHHVMSSTLY